MKTILVPTDFSSNANKALEYASKLALEIDAKIIVMNSYQIPSGSTNVMINFADILEKDSKEELHKNLEEFKNRSEFSTIEYVPFSCYGYITEAIEIAATHYEIDLIVMGTTGVSNLRNKFFGSNTVDAIKKVDYPIVVIPQDVEFKKWENIILASNQDENIINAVEFLNDLINLSKVNLDIVSVIDSKDLEDDKRPMLRNSLTNINYQVHNVVNPNVVDGILTYTSSNDSDVVILLRKTYSFVERIMHTSVTKKLALHGKKTPVII